MRVCARLTSQLSSTLTSLDRRMRVERTPVQTFASQLSSSFGQALKHRDACWTKYSLKCLLTFRFFISLYFVSFHVFPERVSRQHVSYGWHYWPHDNCRSSCGLAGMINLGATCYMASCMQQLYMMPEARASILKVQVGS